MAVFDVQVEITGRWTTFETGFKVMKKAQAFALTASVSNADTQFRVIDKAVTPSDQYPVYLNGLELLRVGEELITLPSNDAALRVLDQLVGGHGQVNALGKLVGRWSETNERLEQVTRAAREQLTGDSSC